MRLRNIPGADEAVLNSPYCIQLSPDLKDAIPDLFDCKAPIHMEIGMGKGRFIMELAKQNPDINFIGMERYSSVLLRALQKMDELSDLISRLEESFSSTARTDDGTLAERTLKYNEAKAELESSEERYLELLEKEEA